MTSETSTFDRITTTLAHDRHPSLPDSLTLLLFAGFDVTRATIDLPVGSMLNGARLASAKRATIALVDDGIAWDGETIDSLRVIPPPGARITITIPNRQRSLPGILLLERDGEEIRMTLHIALRDYLATTLSSEASPNDPIDYLTALSVLQRNYLAHHNGRHAPLADLCDNTHCQRADAASPSSRIYAAVDHASAIAMEADGGYPCYYSVNCGGSTLTPAQVWKHAEPGYSNVSCSHCRNSPRYRWQRTAAATPLTEAMLRGAPAPPFVDDDFKIRVGRAIGFNKVLSNTIDRIERRGRHYVIAGRGFGHRVGMCQEGARQLALHGRSATDILGFYFPTARVSLQR